MAQKKAIYLPVKSLDKTQKSHPKVAHTHVKWPFKTANDSLS
jgi:hypothetical protein